MSNVVRVQIKGRLSYPSLFQPKESKFKKEPMYSADILFSKKDKEQFKILDDARRQAGQNKFPNRDYSWVLREAERSQSLLIKDGDAKLDRSNDPDKYREAYEGKWYITATNSQQPTIVDQHAYRLTEDTGLFYAGCHVVALLNIGCYDFENTKRGFTNTLRGIQFIKDDTPWQGKRTADIGEFQPQEVTENADVSWAD
ncbi:ssDNA-binding protein [Candidatus Liberibacter americanus]|uniref:DUF2815 family protein n=1 Tax=Candidatus Liberibacter americanus str. Sao Paulo TaxID=1261131 RepID=U6B5J3_9HYPH|nr:ssDNA-binding protein [Candidatus Liberibacter americanus]AHA27998.1 hypothetical protein lam_652 [Candidatus Liberibacter americanus str. Sao Paulo]AHA28038.1 hypothetical protein lam_692 [Candidatus Liberibacter americanus str. Sao Paulo]EMS35789.1 hypothetical protein G653_04876 [Candidatus Liberibacter americanus PW_SP]